MKTIKNKLKKLQTLYKEFEKRAEKIALLKNLIKDNVSYDYIVTEYDCDYKGQEWCVKLIQRYSCGDEYTHFYIAEQDMLLDLEELEIKYKEEKEKKELEEKLKKEEQEKKYKLKLEEQELNLYNKLKEKYE